MKTLLAFLFSAAAALAATPVKDAILSGNINITGKINYACLVFTLDNVPKNCRGFELKGAEKFDAAGTKNYLFGYHSSDPDKLVETWQKYTAKPAVYFTDSGAADARKLIRQTKAIPLQLTDADSQVGSFTVIVRDGINAAINWQYHFLNELDAAGRPIWRNISPAPALAFPEF